MKHKFEICPLLIVVLAITFSTTMAFIKAPLLTECGNERWEVKTLRDAGAEKINWDAISANVCDMRKLVQPFPADKKFDKKQRFNYEFNTYSVKCKIREFRKEADGDYHLVLMDLKDTTLTMIGEIPNPECAELKGSKYLKDFEKARAQFEAIKLPRNRVRYGVYELTGVCFFDFIHGQLGVAPNGVELHPVMNLTKSK